MMRKNEKSGTDSQAQQDPQGAEANRMAEPSKNKNADVNIPPPPYFKSYDDIIDSGTTYERAVLYINNYDEGRTFGEGSLSEEQVQRLREALYNTSEEDRSEAIMYVKTYNALIQYGKVVKIAKLSYQNEAAKLTNLIRIKEGKMEAAETIANVYEAAMRMGGFEYDFEKVFKATRIKVKNGKLIFDYSKINAQIKEQAERTAQMLSELKGCLEPLTDYICEEGAPSLWSILPYSLELILDYPDSIEEETDESMRKYFRFVLRERKEKGETVTQEEEEMAVYPDYNEVEIDKPTEEYAKQQLKDSLHLWEVAKRKNTAKRGRPRKKTT